MTVVYCEDKICRNWTEDGCKLSWLILDYDRFQKRMTCRNFVPVKPRACPQALEVGEFGEFDEVKA